MSEDIQRIKAKIAALTDSGKNTAFEMRSLLNDLTETYSGATESQKELQGYSEIGTPESGITVSIGDFNNVSGGTKIVLDDTEEIINFYTTDAPLNKTNIYHRKAISTDSSTQSYSLDFIEKVDSPASGVNTFYTNRSLLNITSPVSNSSEGNIGSYVLAQQSSDRDSWFLYGSDIRATHNGGGNMGFLIGNTVTTRVTGSNVSSVGVMRGLGSNTEVNNVNTTINVLQGMHPTVAISNGNVLETQILFLDFDISGGATIGDLAYIAAGPDGLSELSVSGTARFIDYNGTLQSDFGGVINMNVPVSSITGNTTLTTKEYVDNATQEDILTVATLPALPTQGDRAFVTDANATTFYSIVAGGGANFVPVFYDGSDWRIG